MPWLCFDDKINLSSAFFPKYNFKMKTKKRSKSFKNINFSNLSELRYLLFYKCPPKVINYMQDRAKEKEREQKNMKIIAENNKA